MNVSSDVSEILLPRNASARSRFSGNLIPIGMVQKAKSCHAPPAHLAAVQGMVFALAVFGSFEVRQRLRGSR
jgi:hypothetical protein